MLCHHHRVSQTNNRFHASLYTCNTQDMEQVFASYSCAATFYFVCVCVCVWSKWFRLFVNIKLTFNLNALKYGVVWVGCLNSKIVFFFCSRIMKHSNNEVIISVNEAINNHLNSLFLNNKVHISADTAPHRVHSEKKPLTHAHILICLFVCMCALDSHLCNYRVLRLEY